MNKKDMLYCFIKQIQRNKLLTLFISNIFDYDNLNDNNYLFRMIKNNNQIIIDIYDNISLNRFNRYIFDFHNQKNTIKKEISKDIYITYININKINNNDDKLIKLAYLFKLDTKNMYEYAITFLDKKLVNILENIIKKQTNL